MSSEGDVRQKYCEMPESVALVAAGLMRSTFAGMVTLSITVVTRPLESGPRIAGTPTSATRCVAARCAVVLSAESSHSTTTSGRGLPSADPGRPTTVFAKSSSASCALWSSAMPELAFVPLSERIDPRTMASSFLGSP